MNTVRVVVDNSYSKALHNGWSPSSLNTFVQCPLKYWFKYAQGWREAANLHTAAGGIVHAIIEDLLRLPPDERTIQVARTLYGPHFRAWQEKGEPSDQAAEVAAKVGASITAYFAIEDPTAVEPIDGGLEMPVEGTIEMIAIAGRADRVAYGTGGVRITDYKTGACKPAYSGPYWRQQALYAILLGQAGVDAAEVELMYLGDPARAMVRPVVESLLGRTTSELVTAHEQRQQFDESAHWEAHTSRLCDWCPFKRACPATARAARPTPGGLESTRLLQSVRVLTRNAARAGDPDLVGDPEETA